MARSALAMQRSIGAAVERLAVDLYASRYQSSFGKIKRNVVTQGSVRCIDMFWRAHCLWVNYICEIPTHGCSAVVPKRKEHDFWYYELFLVCCSILQRWCLCIAVCALEQGSLPFGTHPEACQSFDFGHLCFLKLKWLGCIWMPEWLGGIWIYKRIRNPKAKGSNRLSQNADGSAHLRKNMASR